MSRKIYQLLAFLITPVTVFAQPVLNNVEEYNTNGMVIKMVICDPVAPGPAGANQTWDLTGLTETGDSIIQYTMPAISGNPFPSANLAIHTPENSVYVHFEQTPSESLQWGMVDSSGNDENNSYSDPMLIMRRPLTYLDTATDVFAYTSVVGGSFPLEATGDLSAEADAYGTIYLPHDTFENVIRVRIEHNEQDSIEGIGTLIIYNVFYVWYSDEYSSPIFRVDSVSISGLATAQLVDVQYLAFQAEVASAPNVASVKKIQCSGHLSDKSLVLNGSFENGKQYELTLFGINGQQVMKRSFIGSAQQQEFAMNEVVSNGTYILMVRQKGEMQTMNIVKLVK